MSRSVRFRSQDSVRQTTPDEELTPVATKPSVFPIDTSRPTTPTGPAGSEPLTPPLSPSSPTSPTTPTAALQVGGKGGRKPRSRSQKRAETGEPVKKWIRQRGFKKVWVDEKGRETDVEDTDEVPGVNSPPLPPQPEVNKMSVRSYVDTVNDLRDKAAAARHRDGKGAYDDPEIIWLVAPPRGPPGRREGILKMCREACELMGTKRVWIRALDHATTRTITRTGPRRTARPEDYTTTIKAAFPHITVYMGASCAYEYEGHLYCLYERYLVPRGLGRPDIDRSHPDWVKEVVEVLDRKFLRDRALQRGFVF
ncbi:hypothetical protein BJX68DRAFT_270136 [Aspergillus pseudodeflectus]|uniref:Uncharacterized protein n=1 Tax=Aspergillus pseudodeflectus TaxID=176178 RepID=A0ABR4JUZ1_9EURO